MQSQRYSPLSPVGLAVAFAVLALLGATTMGMSHLFGMHSMMSGVFGHYGSMDFGAFELVELMWVVAAGALGGVITAWIYNAIVGERTFGSTDTAMMREQDLPSSP
jgi:hypothetical protein